MSAEQCGGKAAEGFRLSPQQRRVWELSRGEVGAFRSWLETSIDGVVDIAALRHALLDVVGRHEILRTSFSHLPEVGEPLQVIHAAREVVIEVRDLSSPSLPDRERGVREILDDAHRSILDLQAPCLRAVLIKMAADDHRLVVDMPSMCSDAAGADLILEDLCRCYEARVEGGEPAAPALQYADVAQWLLDIGETEHGRLGRSFWRRCRLGHEATLGIRPAAQRGFQPERVVRVLGEDRRADLEHMSARRGATLEETLLACWCVLMWRMSDGDRAHVGTLRDGRTSEELAGMPGLLARYLPFSVPLDPTMSLVIALDLVRTGLAETSEWQDFYDPSDFGGGAQEAATESFDVCFDYIRPPIAKTAAGVTFMATEQESCIERFRLRLSCVDRGADLALVLHYDPESVDTESAELMVDRFIALVGSAIAHCDGPISDLPVLGDAEWDRLVVALNDTRAPFPRDRCVHHLFEEQAQLTPDAPAIRCGDEVASYRNVDERANRLARLLNRRGLVCGQLVGICLDRSIEMVVSVIAVLKAGGGYVPLDPKYPVERVRFMIDDTKARLLITTSRIAESLEGCPTTSVNLDESAQVIQQESDAGVASTVGPDNIAYVIYTSGSTGKPKGVMIDHRGLMISNQARMAYFGEPVGKFLLLSSFSFDSSAVGIFWTMLTGGCLYLVDQAIQQDPSQLGSYIAEHQISHLLTLPSFWGLILEDLEPKDGASLSTVIVAGEPCLEAVVDAHRDKLPGCRLFSEYGATETTIFSSVYDCGRQTQLTAPLGEPIDNARMYILDANLQPVPIGVPGEVYFGGESISPGYFNRPRLTAERFVPDHMSGDRGLRLYQSGDLARYLPDGQFEFLGRTDNQVKIRGFRVELEEIEAALMVHPLVRQAVVGVDASAGSKRLVAYVVGAGQGTASSAELREFLVDRMPDYMVPALFVPMTELPTTPTGKVDRGALPAPGTELAGSGQQFVAPVTTKEKILAQVWGEVLAVGTVGIHDNFFELGGDSILSIHIVSRAKSAGLSLTPLQIFEHQTIAELSAQVGEKRATVAEQGTVAGDVPLTPIQQWFCEQQTPNRNHWNSPLLLEINEPVCIEHLHAATEHLAKHHDALRTRLARDGSKWRQTIVERVGDLPVDTEDLAALSAAKQDTELATRAAAHQRRLDLENGPLMRLVVFDRGLSRSTLLLWIVHHLVIDIVSWRILLEDLHTLLDQLSLGLPLQLAEKTTSYQHWAKALEEYAGSEGVQSEREFWVAELGRAKPEMPLDFEGGRDANTEQSLRNVATIVPPHLTEALVQRVPPACGARISDVLLAGLVEILAEWAGEDSVLIEVEGHGRDERIAPGIDLSRTVGWFTAFHPLALSRSDGTEARDAVKSIKRQFARVPGRGLGYGILRYMNAGASSSLELRDRPVAEVNFNYLGQFDRGREESPILQLASRELRYGLDRDPEGLRSHLLEVVAWVVDEQLEISWFYSENAHRRSTIERLAHGYQEWLLSLVRSLQLDEQGSERSEFGWAESELAQITAAIARAKDSV